jgi:hypothetical protein
VPDVSLRTEGHESSGLLDSSGVPPACSLPNLGNLKYLLFRKDRTGLNVVNYRKDLYHFSVVAGGLMCRGQEALLESIVNIQITSNHGDGGDRRRTNGTVPKQTPEFSNS